MPTFRNYFTSISNFLPIVVYLNVVLQTEDLEVFIYAVYVIPAFNSHLICRRFNYLIVCILLNV
jgi:hypothetical protein